MADELLQEIKADVKDIKGHVYELVKQGAIHNVILAEHEKRSTALEIKLKPLEDSHVFWHKLTMSITTVATILASLATAWYFAVHHTLN